MTIWQNLLATIHRPFPVSKLFTSLLVVIDIITIKIATATTRTELKCFTLNNILVYLRLSLKVINYLTGSKKVQLKLGTKPKLLNIWIILKTRVKYLSMF